MPVRECCRLRPPSCPRATTEVEGTSAFAKSGHSFGQNRLSATDSNRPNGSPLGSWITWLMMPPHPEARTPR